jgi:hypothetical protein
VLPPHVRALADEVSGVIGELGSGEVAELGSHYLDILGIFDRCRSGLGAVRLATKGGFTHEALALGRQIFTESLMLAELAAVSPTERQRIVLGWHLEAIISWEGIFREAELAGKGDHSEELARAAAAKNALRQRAKSAGVKVKTWKVDEKKLAVKHGRRNEYLDFRVSHHFVHGSSFAVGLRWSRSAEKTYLVGGHAADTGGWAAPALLFATDSALFAARSACSIFGWEDPGLEALVERLETLAVELREPRESGGELDD